MYSDRVYIGEIQRLGIYGQCNKLGYSRDENGVNVLLKAVLEYCSKPDSGNV